MTSNLLNALRAAPITGPLLRWRYKRAFFRMKPGTDGWFGEYESFDAAMAAVPKGASVGYDVAPATELYDDLTERIVDSDYPVLFWLTRIMDGSSHLVDLGGHVGIKFYAYRPYLAVLPHRWTVCDVPAVVEAGAKRAGARGEDRLQFTADFADASGADIVLTQGTLQYIETPFAEMIAALAEKPRHVLLNRVPTAPEAEFITLQNIGFTYCPYRIAREGDIARSLLPLGYELVDTWVNGGEARTTLPFSRASRVRWMGHYLRLRESR